MKKEVNLFIAVQKNTYLSKTAHNKTSQLKRLRKSISNNDMIFIIFLIKLELVSHITS